MVSVANRPRIRSSSINLQRYSPRKHSPSLKLSDNQVLLYLLCLRSICFPTIFLTCIINILIYETVLFYFFFQFLSIIKMPLNLSVWRISVYLIDRIVRVIYVGRRNYLKLMIISVSNKHHHQSSSELYFDGNINFVDTACFDNEIIVT